MDTLPQYHTQHAWSLEAARCGLEGVVSAPRQQLPDGQQNTTSNSQRYLLSTLRRSHIKYYGRQTPALRSRNAPPRSRHSSIPPSAIPGSRSGHELFSQKQRVPAGTVGLFSPSPTGDPASHLQLRPPRVQASLGTRDAFLRSTGPSILDRRCRLHRALSRALPTDGPHLDIRISRGMLRGTLPRLLWARASLWDAAPRRCTGHDEDMPENAGSIPTPRAHGFPD